jgi:CheY-like chemotaxis protein
MNNAKHILLGEDDIDDQEILQEVFSSIDSNLDLKFFNNGREVIQHLETIDEHQMPCLIVLDFNMPELNGAEILRLLGDNTRIQHIPKVIWSTSDAPAYKAVCLELGALDYLVKPSRIHLLEETARHMLTYCS